MGSIVINVGTKNNPIPLKIRNCHHIIQHLRIPIREHLTMGLKKRKINHPETNKITMIHQCNHFSTQQISILQKQS